MDAPPPFQRTSTSVASLADRLSAEHPEGVTATRIVQDLLDSHPTYGGSERPELILGGREADGKMKPVETWLAEAFALYDLTRGEIFDGRRVICGLALLDKGLFKRLSTGSFLSRLQEEIAVHAGFQLSPKGKRLLAARRPIRVEVPVLDDAPARWDELDRARLAHVIASRMRRACGGTVVVFGVLAIRERLRRFFAERSIRLRPAVGAARSTLFHVDGPWGSGKSSVLNFVADELTSTDLPKADRWVVVTFSAWKHQRLEPPWWWLTTSLQQGATSALWSIDRPRAVALWLWGGWWRVRDGWAGYFVAGLSAVIAFFLWRAGFFGGDLSRIPDTAESVTKVLALVALAWGAVKALNRRAAAAGSGTGPGVLERTHDPLAMVRRRFARIVRTIRHPVAILVDDLDRCQPEYVVQLLEGIQTLFIEAPVAYVVAADGKWLADAFSTVYGIDETSETRGASPTGRSLGSLYLDKAFQQTFRLARIPDDVRARFWNGLLSRPGEGTAASTESHRDALDIFENLATVGEILETLREQEHHSTVHPSALRLAAVRALEGKAVETEIRNMLDSFSGLIEDNPRAIKKLVNAYGIELETRLPDLPGDEQTLRQLAIWTIVELRWPAVAAGLAAYPDAVTTLAEPPTQLPAGFPEELQPFLSVESLSAVIVGKDVNPSVRLDADAIRLFTGAIAPAGFTPTGGDAVNGPARPGPAYRPPHKSE
jgi:KAP family P-loop domain